MTTDPDLNESLAQDLFRQMQSVLLSLVLSVLQAGEIGVPSKNSASWACFLIYLELFSTW
jgi:hypothetical protein